MTSPLPASPTVRKTRRGRLATAAAALVLAVLAPRGASTQTVQTRGDEVIEGVVRDDATGQPIPGAQVWLWGTAMGAITDTAGRYSLRWHGHGNRAVDIRVCGEELATSRLAEWVRGSSSTVLDFSVRRPADCEPLARPWWDVGPQDTTLVVGRLVYDWEGSFIDGCSGTPFWPVWPWHTVIWDSSVDEPADQFVRLRGRVLGPPVSDSIWPIFLVGEILEKRPATEADCGRGG